MRTRKIVCPNCKKPFRPGGPWPAPDPELPTAKQVSERFELGRNFANKLWNAARFVLLNLEGYRPEALPGDLPIEDRWILSRLAATTDEITQRLEEYRFSDVARSIYDFAWSEFCDQYVEISKERLRDPQARPLAQRVLAGVLDGLLRLVQPIMPFVSESIWHALREAAPERGLPTPVGAAESVVIAPWPAYPDRFRDADVDQRIGRMQDLVRGIREVRNRYRIDPRTPLKVFVRCPQEVARDFAVLAPIIIRLAGIGEMSCGPDTSRPTHAATRLHPDFEAYVSLEGIIDVNAEIQRLIKQREEKTRLLDAKRKKLAEPTFVERAPADIVQRERAQAAELESQIETIDANVRELQQA